MADKKSLRQAAKGPPGKVHRGKSTPRRKRNPKPDINHWAHTNVERLDWHEPFLEAYSKNLNIRDAATKVGISRQTVYQHMDKYPDFAERVEDARMQCVEKLESVGYQVALKGDTGMIKFLLSHNHPARYQKAQPVLIITPEMLATMSNEELRLLTIGQIPKRFAKLCTSGAG